MAAGHRDRETQLLEAGLTLTLDLELPAMLRRLVDSAADITGARWCAFGVLGASGAIVDLIATGPRPRGYRAPGLPAPGPRVLRVPVRVRETTFGDLCVAGKRALPEFDIGDQRSLEILAAHAGVAIENATLLEEAERRARRLEAMREVAAKLLAGSRLDELLELTASHAMRLARADAGIVLVPGSRDGTLVMQAIAGDAAVMRAMRGMEVPLDRSVSGLVLRTGETKVIGNLSADPMAYPPATETAGQGPAMFVPLRAHHEPFGALVVSRAVGKPAFVEPDVELVETFADQAAVAFEYARVHRELRRLAVREDRERIARELHDGAIQALFAVGMGLQATATRTAEPEVTRRLQGAVGELDGVIGDLRNYIFGLQQGVLAGRRVDQALRSVADEIAVPAGVTTVVEIDEQVATELSHHAGDLVQLVREALSNVSRHALATTCRVSLYWGQPGGAAGPARTAVLEIDDDGRGFDPDHARRGSGLGNLRTRATVLGGTLELDSGSGEGTTVRVLIPV